MNAYVLGVDVKMVFLRFFLFTSRFYVLKIFLVLLFLF